MSAEPKTKRKPKKRIPSTVAPGPVPRIRDVLLAKDERYKEIRRRALKHPAFIESADGSGGFYKSMRSMSGTVVSIPPPEVQSHIMYSIPHTPIPSLSCCNSCSQKPDDAYDAKNLATFIKLSNKTGFSRKKLRTLFRQWSAFTKEDMPRCEIRSSTYHFYLLSDTSLTLRCSTLQCRSSFGWARWVSLIRTL